MADSDNLVPCATCQTLIEGTHMHRVGPFEMHCQQTHCKECDYREQFRLSRLVERPYRMPFPRPTKEGKMPAVVKEELMRRRQREKSE